MYYQILKGLCDEVDALEAPYMCTCNCTCTNGRLNGAREGRKRLLQFLMGLDECFPNIRGQIQLMQPMPNATKAYAMLRQEEKQREATTPQFTTPTVMSTFSNSRQSTDNSVQTLDKTEMALCQTPGKAVLNQVLFVEIVTLRKNSGLTFNH
ncbi:hypothetical protein Tco_0986123 [Tanacetum coccineum]